MRLTLLISTAAFATAMVVTPALSKPQQTTKYSYYTVGGSTAVEIYSAMLKRGPRVNGAKAYASTSATSSQDGKLIQTGSCRIENYKLRIDFVINLPKIKNEKALAAGDRARWKQFSQFLKRHEEHHRAIWLDCASDLERKVQKIRLKNCKDADAKATALWNATRAACTKRHDAFDRAEQKKLMRHPFVQLVYKRSARMAHAASAE